ncbi:hypothetical protein D9758_012461 [Tetrapyrgos nigripes]|uniref:Uncharacterized protein n=1 Tax=Tetrapyrgos nigripes TaxID=182062 RepID=A0A8H5FVM0_9AGAR|nr:hypothetical protein D9758_012461 [Tetrapyrgos nigripes]
MQGVFIHKPSLSRTSPRYKTLCRCNTNRNKDRDGVLSAHERRGNQEFDFNSTVIRRFQRRVIIVQPPAYLLRSSSAFTKDEDGHPHPFAAAARLMECHVWRNEGMGYEGAKESGRTATGSGSLMETEGDCRTSDGLLLIRPRPGKPGLWSRASVQHLHVMSPTPPQPGTTVADGAHVGGVEFFSIY